jgi:hypothetical protein
MLAMQQLREAVERVAAEAFELVEPLADAPRAARAAVQVLDARSRPWLANPNTLPRTSDTRNWVERADRYAAPRSTDCVYPDIWVGMVNRPGAVDDALLHVSTWLVNLATVPPTRGRCVRPDPRPGAFGRAGTPESQPRARATASTWCTVQVGSCACAVVCGCRALWHRRRTSA